MSKLIVLTLFSFLTVARPEWALAQIRTVAEEAQSTAISHAELEAGIKEGLKKVSEFAFIKEIAEELNLRVYLFGGTASSFGHYVKWDLQRQKGDRRYQPDRFDYDYTNIFRSTQDLDIAIDGDPEQISRLHQILLSRYRHLQGSKQVWDFRPLRQSVGEAGEPNYREGILNDPNFQNQHTDTQSTGLIEITNPERSGVRVKDALEWENTNSRFLRDLLQSTIHYSFSEKHNETDRYKMGLNPPIFSVIRYLTKAFQYELTMLPEDLRLIEKIIADLNPRDLSGVAVRDWLDKNGVKMINHAVNLEYAYNWLQKLGLSEKLKVVGSKDKVGSLAWWMSKEPLRTKPIGNGRGKTAAELDIKMVAHETGDMLAFESITRAHTGEANVLISRSGVEGEQAAYGNGFYTQKGKFGARGTGLTIRFQVHPQAREGKNGDFQDFGEYVLVHNKAVLTVIQESLTMTPLQYFKVLASDSDLARRDKGLMEKFRRKVQTSEIPTQQLEAIKKIVRAALVKDRYGDAEVVIEWLRFKAAAKDEALLKQISSKESYQDEVLENFKNLAEGNWSYQELIELLRDRSEWHPEAVILAARLAKNRAQVIHAFTVAFQEEENRAESSSRTFRFRPNRQRQRQGADSNPVMIEALEKNWAMLTRFEKEPGEFLSHFNQHLLPSDISDLKKLYRLSNSFAEKKVVYARAYDLFEHYWNGSEEEMKEYKVFKRAHLDFVKERRQNIARQCSRVYRY